MRKQFEWLQVMLASPEDILSWSHGSVESPDTINYRTWKPKQKWLFCEAIFGPMKNYECSCGKYKGVRYKGIVCERCGVEVTTSRVRRERMGHIELAAPVVHVWYIKATPSRVWLLLNLSVNDIEKILYFVKYVVTGIDEQQKKKVLSSLDKDYLSKVNELDTIYEQEKKSLASQATTKKPKDMQLADDELRKLYTTNKSSLEKEYSRIKSILANLKLWSTVLESDYRNVFWKYDQAFTFASGSHAILSLLKQVHVSEEIQIILNGFFKFKGEERKKAYKNSNSSLVSLSLA
jgi:DNA-directed RNA polymerase subunit beta'